MGYLVAVSLIWAFSFGLIKQFLTGLDPYLVSLLRLALSFLFFLPFLRPVPLALGWRLAACGAVQFGLMYCLYIASYQFLASHEVALMTVTTPLLVVLFDGFSGRRWPPAYWLAAMLAVGGALVLVRGGEGMRPALTGILLVQGANGCFAAGQLLYKRLCREVPGKHRHFGWLYLGALIPPAFFLLFSATPARGWPPSPAAWLTLGYLGIVASGLCFFLWNKGVCAVNNGTAAAMNNFKAPFAVLAAWLIFAEPVSWYRVLTSLVLLGGALALTEWVARNPNPGQDGISQGEAATALKRDS